VHIDDATGVVLYALDQAGLEGPYNAVAPEPVRNKDLARALGRAMRRPSFVAVPPALLRLQLGGGASVLTASQRVLPKRTQEAGYAFRFPSLEAALADLARRRA
jgi:NAD dependent epimerase/dehydratase family enzyme